MHIKEAGFSVVEAMLAIAVFSLFTASFVGAGIQGLQSTAEGGERVRAQALITEGFAAVESIADAEWNSLTLTQSGVEEDGTEWSFSGEGTTDTIGLFTRTITFEDVCRDGSEIIAACPAAYTDPQTKQVTIEVTWDGPYRQESISSTALFTHWDHAQWQQTDWVGGVGQTQWTDETQYESDDGNVDTATAGQLQLASINGCTTQTWDFSVDSDYTISDPLTLEITSGAAQLIATGSIGTTLPASNTANFEFDTSDGITPSVVHVSGTVYVIAYTGPGSDGWLRTVNIGTNGAVSALPVTNDTYEFDSSNGDTPDIIHISGNVYAIAYTGPGNDGWLATVTIASNGDITQSVIDRFEFDTTNGVTPRIVHVSGNVYAITYTGQGNDGWLATVEIDSAGGISSAVDSLETTLDTFEFDTSTGLDADIEQIDTDTYAIAYTGQSSHGELVTVDIAASGNISNVVDSLEAVTDSLTFDATQGQQPDIYPVSGDIYLLAYQGGGNDGWITSMDIDAAGNIAVPGVSPTTLEFDPIEATNLTVIATSEPDEFLIAYEDSGNDGIVSIVEVASDGTVGSAVIDSYEYETSSGETPFIVSVGTGVYAIFYEGPSGDGWVSTLELGAGTGGYSTVGPSVRPNTAYTPTNIDAWTVFTETATKGGTGQIYYQLSDDGGSTWQYWNGSAWATAGSADYSPATDINTNIATFSTNDSFLFRAFLVSDGTNQVQLDEVSIECDYTGYETSAALTSSAFDMGAASTISSITWTEVLPTENEDIQVQLRATTDSGGSPNNGSWTDWYGAEGSGTYFTEPLGEAVSADLNGNQWMQYRVELTGDSSDTPMLEDITVNYE